MIKNFKDNEHGSIAILSALVMVVIIGFTALAVDAGYLYYRHIRLQDVADSIAISAAERVASETGNNENKKMTAGLEEALYFGDKLKIHPVNPVKITTLAYTAYTADITTEGNEKGQMTISYPDGLNKVRVELKVEANTYFARVFGNNAADMKLSATAKIGQATQHTGQLLPISFFWKSYTCGELYKLSLSPLNKETGGTLSGNSGYLDYEGQGNGEQFRDHMENGYDGTLKKDQLVPTYTGLDVGPVEAGIEYRINLCNSTHSHTVSGITVQGCVYESYVEDCPRIAVVPIIKDFWEDTNGKTWVTIGGFAKLFIVDYDKSNKELSGYFIGALDSSEINGEASKYMVNGVGLLE